jgi:cell division transport system permease protein
VKKSYLISTITSAILLFIMGILLLLILKGQSITQDIKASAKLIVEIAPSATQEQVQSIKLFVSSMEQVDLESVQLVTKEDAAMTVLGLEEQDRLLDTINPFLDIILFNLVPDQYDIDFITQLEIELASKAGVSNFFYEDSHIKNIEASFTKIKLSLLVIASILIFLVIVLLHNMIRMMLMAKKKQIEIMQLVGATPQFIRSPFIWDSIYNGFYSALLASIGLIGVVVWINLALSDQISTISWLSVLGVVIFILLLGFVVSILSTYIIVNLYLKNLSKIS